MVGHSRAGGLGPPTLVTSLVLFLALSLVAGPALISSGCRPPAHPEAADDVGAQPGPGGSSGTGSQPVERSLGDLSPDLDLRTGAHGVVGGGGQAHWSPVPATAETGEG